MKTTFAIMCVTVALSAGSAAAQKNAVQSVVVTNTTDAPVPTAPQGITNVEGTVEVSGSVDVNVLNIPSVSLNGIPTVNLSSGSNVGITGPVQVASAEGNPLQVRDASHATAYMIAGTTGMAGGQNLVSHYQSIPAGKMFVIESVSYKARVPSGETLQLATALTAHQQAQSNDMPLSYLIGSFELPVAMRGFEASTGHDLFTGSQSVRFYSHGAVGFTFFRSHSTLPSGTLQYYFFGYLVDVP
jgi:hypothetical protein